MAKCCSHCGCQSDDLTGHDDTCALGCNDTEEQRLAEKDEAIARVRLILSKEGHK